MEYVQGNIFIREMRFDKAGQIVDGHAHNFDHTTYVAHGAALIEALADDDSVLRSVVKRASDGFNFVLIAAGVRHRITALEPSVLHCIYAHRNPQGDVVEHYDGWMRGYE